MSARRGAVNPGDLRAYEDRLIARAVKVLEHRLAEPAERYTLNCPHAVKTYARLRLAELEREVFVVAFLDVLHRVIAIEQLFEGTLTRTAVWPREIARAALRHNAAAVILIHNHPSGMPEFSESDNRITEALRSALGLIDVSVLDHVLVAGARVVSMATLEQSAEATDRARLEGTRALRSAAMKAAWARRKAAKAAL